MSGSMGCCFYIIKRRRRMPNSTRFQTKLTLFVSFRQLIVKYKAKNSGIAGPNRLCFSGKLLRYHAVVLSYLLDIPSLPLINQRKIYLIIALIIRGFNLHFTIYFLKFSLKSKKYFLRVYFLTRMVPERLVLYFSVMYLRIYTIQPIFHLFLSSIYLF